MAINSLLVHLWSCWSALLVSGFLDFYSCVSSSGTLGFCLPQPYCSYMVDGGVLDPTPTKGCSHTMLSDYGCCTLPCGASNNFAAKSAAIPSIVPQPPAAPKPPPPSLPPIISAPPALATTTTRTTTLTVQNMPPLFSPPITSSSIDFAVCGKPNSNFQDVVRKFPADSQLAPTGRWCWQVN